jgi:hypothetical protein
MFGSEARAISASAFKDGLIIHQVDYWDGCRIPERAMAVPDSEYPVDLGLEGVSECAATVIDNVARKFQSAFLAGNATAAAEFFSVGRVRCVDFCDIVSAVVALEHEIKRSLIVPGGILEANLSPRLIVSCFYGQPRIHTEIHAGVHQTVFGLMRISADVVPADIVSRSLPTRVPYVIEALPLTKSESSCLSILRRV